MFAAGDCFYEKEISLRHPGLLLAAPFISAVRGAAAEFETEAADLAKIQEIVAFEESSIINEGNQSEIYQKL